MRAFNIKAAAVALAVLAAFALPAVHGEVVEEIVAWINGDIITMSEFQQEEQAMMEDLYRRFTGEELDRYVAQAQAMLLRDLIDRKILLQRADRLFDLEAIGDSYMQEFKQMQNVSNDEELARLLSQAGVTVPEFKKQMIERYAPSLILRMEVDDRIAVGDKEVVDYYEANPEEFRTPAEVTIREIVILDEGNKNPEARARAEEIRNRALATETDFAELAKEVSEAGTASSGGLLGPLNKGDLSTTLEEIAFTLEPGVVSEVLTVPYGYHIVRVENRVDARTQTLEEVADSVRAKLENERYGEQLDKFLKRVRNEADVRVADKYAHRMPRE